MPPLECFRLEAPLFLGADAASTTLHSLGVLAGHGEYSIKLPRHTPSWRGSEVRARPRTHTRTHTHTHLHGSLRLQEQLVRLQPRFSDLAGIAFLPKSGWAPLQREWLRCAQCVAWHYSSPHLTAGTRSSSTRAQSGPKSSCSRFCDRPTTRTKGCQHTLPHHDGSKYMGARTMVINTWLRKRRSCSSPCCESSNVACFCAFPTQAEHVVMSWPCDRLHSVAFVPV